MRSQKLLIVSATMLACTSLATAAVADDTKTPSTSGASGASSVTSQTVTTPSSPTTSTTSTTTTTQGSPSPSTATTPTTPTSTTMTTSADDATAASAPGMTTSAPPSGESTVVYQRRTPNKAMLITGSSFLVSTYVTTAALAGYNGGIGDKDLYIPIVGPWINIAERTPSTYANNTRDTVLIAGSGVLQGVGALMAVASFFVPEKIPAARISAGNVKMEIVPTAAAGTGGLGALGVF